MPAVAGAAHATEGVTDTTIRIGMSSPLSGPTGAYGRAMKEGIEACFAQVNARGGVEGRRLELVALDDGYDVAAAADAISKSGAQAVVMATLYRPTAEFIRRMRATGASPFFVALSPVGTDQLIAELGPEHTRGIQVSQVIPYPWGDKLEVVRQYKSALSAHAHHANYSYYGLEGYLNARLMVAALERAGRGTPTRERLMGALRSGPYDLNGYRINYPSGSNEGSSYVEISVIGAAGRILN